MGSNLKQGAAGHGSHCTEDHLHTTEAPLTRNLKPGASIIRRILFLFPSRPCFPALKYTVASIDSLSRYVKFQAVALSYQSKLEKAIKMYTRNSSSCFSCAASLPLSLAATSCICPHTWSPSHKLLQPICLSQARRIAFQGPKTLP